MSLGDLQLTFDGARCLVTGGAGFIGSNLTRELLRLGATVTVVDNFSTGRREHLPVADGLRTIEADIARYDQLKAVAESSDYVFHLAACVGNVKSIAAPGVDAEANILGTVRLIEACRGTRVRRIVYSSSSAIFGEAEIMPIGEEHPQRPASFYALSKMTGERYMRLAADLFGLPTVCLRYFNVYGLPMEDNEYTGVISIFLQRLERGSPLTIYGDGRQVRDFVHVSDVVQANLRAARAGRTGGVYNIGTGTGTSITSLAELLAELTSRPASITYADFRAGEVRNSTADITRARAELGFAPAHSTRSGLAALVSALPSSAERRDR
jgi:UDP-glucose 4-epimerase